MAEGSDGSGSESGEMDVGGGSYGNWNTGRTNKRKKSVKSDGCDSDGRGNVTERKREDFNIIIKLAQEGASFGDWNPIQLTKSISKEIGEVRSAKILRDGSLIIICKDGEQQGKAIKINKINGKKVHCSLMNDRKWVRGVITGIPVNVTAENIKGNVTNAKVSEARRLKTNRNGIRSDSLSVLVTFDEKRLPEKILIGYMCYEVRPYVPPPLRCFKCQRFGHVASVCKGKQTCGRCGGNHEYGKCAEGTKLKCCNCGGEHSSAYRGCEVSKRAEEVQRIKTTQGISYAEAARKVSGDAQVIRQSDTRNQDVVKCGGCNRLKEETLIVNKNDFVFFMADVVNCSAQTKSRNERIKIIVKSAEKYLDVRGLLWETVKDILNEDNQPSQTCVGSS